MQSKGIIRLITIALILVSIYYLTFTFVTRNVESKAKAYASEKAAVMPDSVKEISFRDSKISYLDSLSNKKIFLGSTYQQCKDRSLALGLDLQGGMSVVLQVSLEELIRNMSGKSQDPAFLAALEEAKKLQSSSNKDLVTLFGEVYQKNNPTSKLAAIFATRENKDKIAGSASNKEVIAAIEKEAGEAVNRTYSIISSRVDRFGQSSANISLDKNTGRILLELPGVENPTRVRRLLQANAQLEFWETYKLGEVYSSLEQANKILRGIVKVDTTKQGGTAADLLSETKSSDSTQTANASTDTSKTGKDTSESSLLSDTGKAESDSSKREAFIKDNPLYAVLSMPLGADQAANKRSAEYCLLGHSKASDTAKLMNYLRIPAVKGAFKNDIKFIWGAKPISNDTGDKYFELYAIKKRIATDEAPLNGSVITDARQEYDTKGEPSVSMQMNSQGAKDWKKMTGAAVGRQIAIVLDNQVYSAPNVNGEIAGGNSQISGSFTVEEALDLAAILKAGKLPAPARIVEEELVGPTLGKESIRNGMISLLIGLILVMILMVLVYNRAGWIANGILFLNLLFLLATLSSLGTALTLAGMAGILLTVAIAVDANILIFERIKEELALGKSVKAAVKDGYDHALSSILDANITNLITGFVMIYFGLGPVKGFAVVLVCGILYSLFTAILLSRVVIEWCLDKNYKLNFSTDFTKNLFKNINIDFVGMRKIGYVISGTVILVGIISMFTRGFDYGVDFQGGRTYTIRFNEAVDANSVRDALTPIFGDVAPVVKTFGTSNQLRITTTYKINEQGTQIDSLVERKLYEGLKGKLGNIDFAGFEAKHKLSSQTVGKTISDDITSSSILAALISLILIFIYIVFRFRKWQYGLGAIFATVHDVMFVLAFFSLLSHLMPFSLEIDQTFIAAILTIIGYSLNDTVVVFDRIREYLGSHKNQDMKQVINSAINNTLSRTLMTSLVAFLVIFVLFLFGGEMIRGFSFALLLGIVVGTYSSIFIATPVVVDLTKEENKVIK